MPFLNPTEIRAAIDEMCEQFEGTGLHQNRLINRQSVNLGPTTGGKVTVGCGRTFDHPGDASGWLIRYTRDAR